MMKINKRLIKNTLKLNNAYFCFLKKIKMGQFLFNSIYDYYYPYGNVVIFSVERMLLQLLKVLYLSFDIIQRKGMFFFFFEDLFNVRYNRSSLFDNRKIYVVNNWIPGIFSNKFVVMWLHLRYKLKLITKKPSLAFFLRVNSSTLNIVKELVDNQIPIVAPTKFSEKNLLRLIDYPLSLNGDSLYTLYFFCCLLLRILWKK